MLANTNELNLKSLAMKNKTKFFFRDRLIIHNFRIFFSYWVVWTDWLNEYFDFLPWRIREDQFIVFGITPNLKKPFGVEKFYYDGHTQTFVCFFWLAFGHGYTYDSRPVEQWNGE